MLEPETLSGFMQILTELGISGVFKNVFSLGLFMILLKKYLFNGFGEFLKNTIAEWLKNERERIISQTHLSDCLHNVELTITKIADSQIADRQNYTQMIAMLTRSIEEKLQLSHLNRQLIVQNRKSLQFLKKKIQTITSPVTLEKN